MTYYENIQQISNITFDEIVKLNKDLVPTQFREKPWNYPGLNHGTALLKTEEQCYAYISAYGKMHQSKIREVLEKIKVSEFKNYDIQIIDWGCGQGLATICFFDYFIENGIDVSFVKKVVLIEPSILALNRATVHVKKYLKDENKIIAINKYVDDVLDGEIKSGQPITIHLFSNILDIPTIDLRLLSNKIKNGICDKHYFFCMGPLNYGNNRIDAFWNYFSEATNIFENSHGKQQYDLHGRLDKSYKYTAKNRVFKIDGNTCELIAVDYFYPKQFHAAYQLDAVKNALMNEKDKEKIECLYKNLSDFEVQTPFDIGASIYEDVHPIYAVLNNIVTRGLPTKASPFIEKSFTDFGNKETVDDLGNISFSMENLNYEDLFFAMHIVDSRWNITKDNYNSDILDSNLEKEFIDSIPQVLRQLLEPQRELSSITKSSYQHSQRVDFSFEFPYSSKDDNGIETNGFAFEIDGDKYHTNVSQQIYDQQRISSLKALKWTCERIIESDVHKIQGDFKHLGSEYVFNTEKVINRKFDQNWATILQIILSPIAIARFEKVILEALMTGKLNIYANKWKVLVKEHDVPCAALAFEDLKRMFESIVKLSTKYSDMHFPEIDLTIISSPEFSNSPLHHNTKTIIEDYHSNDVYDMVVDFAILRRVGLERINFSEYKCKNKCYFVVRSAHIHRNDRQIYTSDRIEYKPLVVRNRQGKYDDIIESVELMEYFLRLLFRKEKFRPGQTPILSRAIQNKSVIGLLPTGGGKSLTYQIAALLQPGITLVVDPLRSLMKDQYDGLIKAGIDVCTYINSSIEVPKEICGTRAIKQYRIEERERRACRMERSELLFVFLSPERLSILNFRERLKNMHETGVYFSYGVIDEVHCVSEWGHDFRFSYLHLGRNLYQYVLPKQTSGDNSNNHISLFGLTATASFDVLSDVERELSGNGAFPLDPDTIVRDGDTNRVEIQYKIESIPVSFKQRENGTIRVSSWEIYDKKKEYLDNLISKMPEYFFELQTKESVNKILSGYEHGPRGGRNVNL